MFDNDVLWVFIMHEYLPELTQIVPIIYAMHVTGMSVACETGQTYSNQWRDFMEMICDSY